MAHVGRQGGQLGVHVSAGPVPVEQGGDGEGMTQRMRPKPAACRACRDASPARQAEQRPPDVGVDEPGAPGGYEEAGLAGCRAEPVACPGVIAQGADRAGVQRELTGLIPFGVADQEKPCSRVDIIAAEPDGLPDAQAGHCQQPEERAVGGGPQRWSESAGGCHEAGERVLAEQVRSGPLIAAAEQVSCGHLGAGIEGCQVSGEAARNRQPGSVPVRAGTRRDCRPGQREPGGDRARPGFFQVGDELGEQPGVTVKLEPERPADADVVLRRLAQPAHAALPGQRRATRRSAAGLTLA